MQNITIGVNCVAQANLATAGVDQDIQHQAQVTRPSRLEARSGFGNVDVSLLQHRQRLLDEGHLYRIIEGEGKDVPA